LPIKRPRLGCQLHERRNGHFVLQVTGTSFQRLIDDGSERIFLTPNKDDAKNAKVNVLTFGIPASATTTNVLDAYERN
jgi:predicted aspartyl protease